MDEGGSSRIVAFDHVRGLAVIFMIISHVAVVLGSGVANKTVIGHIMDDVCGTAPAAPVFMMLMGVFVPPRQTDGYQNSAGGEDISSGDPP